MAQEQDWPSPSYAQVYRIVQRLPKELVVLGQEGEEKYRETFDLLYRREAKSANAIWQVDHCRLHIWLVNERGRASKPWLTMVLDDYSRSICGYRLSWSGPSAYQTSLVLRQASLCERGCALADVWCASQLLYRSWERFYVKAFCGDGLEEVIKEPGRLIQNRTDAGLCQASFLKLEGEGVPVWREKESSRSREKRTLVRVGVRE